MQKETEKQMYSAPSSELLEMAQETIICASNELGTPSEYGTGTDPFNF